MDSQQIDLNRIGFYVRNLRDMLGLTRQELAERSGCSVPWLNELESGVYESPGVRNLQKIANALNLSLAEMFQQFETLEGMSGSGDRDP